MVRLAQGAPSSTISPERVSSSHRNGLPPGPQLWLRRVRFFCNLKNGVLELTGKGRLPSRLCLCFGVDVAIKDGTLGEHSVSYTQACHSRHSLSRYGPAREERTDKAGWGRHKRGLDVKAHAARQYIRGTGLTMAAGGTSARAVVAAAERLANALYPYGVPASMMLIFGKKNVRECFVREREGPCVCT